MIQRQLLGRGAVRCFATTELSRHGVDLALRLSLSLRDRIVVQVACVARCRLSDNHLRINLRDQEEPPKG